MRLPCESQCLRSLAAAVILSLFVVTDLGAQSVPTPEVYGPMADGPLRLRQAPLPEKAPSPPQPPTTEGADSGTLARSKPDKPYAKGEFERFVQLQAGPDVEIRRYGAELIIADGASAGADINPMVPQEYVLGPGDEVLVTLWGSVDADLRLVVDRAGRVAIPRVGTVQVSGVRYGDLAEVINRRISQVFRNFQSSVTLGQLRGIRVFVTGFVEKAGSYSVSSLSTVVRALMAAGGPSASGSFRDIQVRRNGAMVARIDLYDLLLNGDIRADITLRAGDVVHVGAVGKQVGVIGSVNRPVVVELKAGETVSDALRMAGGFTAVADRTRVARERVGERNAPRVEQLQLPAQADGELQSGDVLRAFSVVAVALPTQRQSKRVKIEGEVAQPGEYVLAENSTVADAVRAAGGYTDAAFLYATEFVRLSVQRTQADNYDRFLRDLETDFTRSTSALRITSSEEASAQAARSAAANRLIERLRAVRPSGRVVLRLEPDATALPDLALEDGDRIYVPPRPTTVGVFGSVFNASSYLYLPGGTVGHYLRMAGGPTAGADEESIFMIRPNGEVMSQLQRRGWFNRSDSLLTQQAEPGDTLFVPEQMNKTTFIQMAKDWTQILSQFGLGAAAIKVLGN